MIARVYIHPLSPSQPRFKDLDAQGITGWTFVVRPKLSQRQYERDHHTLTDRFKALFQRQGIPEERDDTRD
jgi:hypothetical protein